ncbi:MAG: HAD-IA family hydrolase [Endomicrobia bacterium]|nr:HAD-IA family hydrolase [Endomicrobiia bacterium]
MNYDFLIFDLDGTIVDSERDLTSAINMVRQEFGFEPLTIEKVRSYVGSGIKALVDKAVPERSEEIHERALERFKFHYSRVLTDTTAAYDGIAAMLEALKDKKKAVLSNKTEIFSHEIIKRLGLKKYFVEIWGGDTAGKKPDPKPILDLIKVTGSQAAKTVMIGDSSNDFKAAKAAGIASIAVLYGYGGDIDRIKELKPDYIAEKPEDIVDIVTKKD